MPQGNQWFQNNQWAGTKGQAKRMEAFVMEPIHDHPMEYRAHVQNKGWM